MFNQIGYDAHIANIKVVSGKIFDLSQAIVNFYSSGLTQPNFMIGMGWGIVDESDWVYIKIVGDLAQTFQVSGVSVLVSGFSSYIPCS